MRLSPFLRGSVVNEATFPEPVRPSKRRRPSVQPVAPATPLGAILAGFLIGVAQADVLLWQGFLW